MKNNYHFLRTVVWPLIIISSWVLVFILYIVGWQRTLYHDAIIGFSIGVTCLWIMINFKVLIKTMKSPSFIQKLKYIAHIVLAFFFFLLGYYVVYQKSNSVDFTKNKLYALTDQSIQIAKQIHAPMKISIFAKKQEWNNYLEFLNSYVAVNSLIKVIPFDIEKNPTLAKKHNLDKSGSVLIEYKGKVIKGLATSELNFINSLLKMIKSRRERVCATNGHGETSLLDRTIKGASFLYNNIQDYNYVLDEIDVSQNNDLKKDCDLVLIFNPRTDFYADEIKNLRTYAKRGGNFIVLKGIDFQETPMSNLNDFLVEFTGMRFLNHLILDKLATLNGSAPQVPYINRYNVGHEITKRFNYKTVFPYSAHIDTKEIEGVRSEVVAQTASFPAAWAEKNLKIDEKTKVFFDEGIDLEGPLNVMMTAYVQKYHAKFLLISSGDFVTNAYQNFSSNFNLLLNGLEWTLDSQKISSLSRPKLSSELVVLSNTQVSLVFFLSVILFPLVLFITAFYFYRRKSVQ